MGVSSLHGLKDPLACETGVEGDMGLHGRLRLESETAEGANHLELKKNIKIYGFYVHLG